LIKKHYSDFEKRVSENHELHRLKDSPKKSCAYCQRLLKYYEADPIPCTECDIGYMKRDGLGRIQCNNCSQKYFIVKEKSNAL